MTEPAALSLAERLEDWAANPHTADGVGYIMEQAAALIRSLQAELEDERQASQESYDERMAEIESLQAENERRLAIIESWIDKDAQHCRVIAELEERLAAAEAENERWHAKCDEVGIPHDPEMLVRHHRANAGLAAALDVRSDNQELRERLDVKYTGLVGAMEHLTSYVVIVEERLAATEDFTDIVVDALEAANKELTKLRDRGHDQVRNDVIDKVRRVLGRLNEEKP